MKHKDVIVVAGHHRGGTSAAAGALVHLGFYPGPAENLMPPSADNAKGYFEFLPIVNQHDRLLLALDRTWADNRPFAEGWTRTIPFKQARKRLAEMLRQLTGEAKGRPVVVKDPRVVRFLPLYQDACADASLRLRALVVDRDPDAVVASLMKRDGWDDARAREFVGEQAAYLRDWTRFGGVGVSFPSFLDAGGREIIAAARRLVPGELKFDPRVLAAHLDAGLVNHG